MTDEQRRRVGTSKDLPFDLRTVKDPELRSLLETIIKAQQQNNDSLLGDIRGIVKGFNLLAGDVQSVAEYLGAETDSTGEVTSITGGATVQAHADLEGVTANQHHAQSHTQADHDTAEAADLAAVTPDAAAAAGTSVEVPNADHQHGLATASSAAAAVGIDSGAAAGTSGTVQRAAHVHQVATTDAPSGANVSVDAAPSAGSTGAIARATHGHRLDTASAEPGAVSTTTSGTAGTSTTAPSRGDHSHDLGFDDATADPAAVSTSAADGTATSAARKDHVHAHEAAHLAHDTLWDAKGDVVSGSGADTAVKTTVGADGTVLTADAASAGGVKWDTPAGGAALDVQEGGVSVENPVDTLNFDASDFNLTNPVAGEADVALNYGTGAGQPAEGNHSHVGGGSTVAVQEDDVDVDTAAATLDFGHGLDVTSSPAGEANIVVDEGELDHDTIGGTPTHTGDDLTPHDVTVSGALTAQANAFFDGAIVPTSTTATTTGAISDLAFTDVYYWNGASAADLHGIVGSLDGALMWVQNITAAQMLTLKHESGTEATAARRLYCPAGVDYSLGPREGVMLSYSTTTSRWMVLGKDVSNLYQTTATKQRWYEVGEGAVDSTGGAALTQQGTLPDRREFHLWADGVADNGSMFNIAVPDDWDSGALTVKVYAEGTTAFNGTTDAWVCKTDYLYASDNDSANAAGTSTSTTITPAANSGNDLLISQALSIGTPGAAGQYVRLYIERRGNVAADTYTGNLRVFGVMLEYTATTVTSTAPSAGSMDGLTDAVITSAAADDQLVYDGSNWVNTQLTGLFGDGSDGALTFTAAGPTTGGATRSGLTYTMTRDIFATSLTVDSTVIIDTSNYRIFVQDTLTNNGTIRANGTDASGTTNGSGATRGSFAGPSSAGGAGLASGTTTLSGNAGVTGGSSSGTYSPGKALGSGSNGGAGGNANGGSGGTNASATAFVATPQDYVSIVRGAWYTAPSTATGNPSFLAPHGATGGGGGGRTTGGTATASGAGGGGGGVVLVVARIIDNSSGVISANGGNGSNATGGTCSAGGGGGGGGGTVFMVYNKLTAGTETASGGTKGSGLNGAAAAADGNAGVVIKLAMR